MFKDTALSTTIPKSLSETTLGGARGDLSVPEYDRSLLAASTVHIGLGAFHRSHQAAYFHELAQQGDTAWGVVGVGLRSGAGGRALARQDCLYSLIERGDGDRVRVIGSIQGYIHAPDDMGRALAALASSETKLVTLTVTGGAYKVDLEGRELDVGDPEVQADLATPWSPATVPGVLVEGLRLRRAAGAPPLTIMSCDNVPANGDLVRASLVSFAWLRDPSLADWIDATCAFPGTVVDRITPGTCPEAQELLVRRYGIWDRAPVVAEPYSQWTIEDEFAGARPPLDEVGAEFVGDVSQHELVKKRLLNGSHTAMAYLATLMGAKTTDEAMADPCIRKFLERVMAEVSPLLPSPPGVDLEGYREELIERFSNPRIGDPLTRLCARGSVKMPSYVLPSLREANEEGLPHEALTLAVAAWIRFLRGVGYEGEPLEIEDPQRSRLRKLARGDRGRARAFLAEETIFGDLGSDERVATELSDALTELELYGPRRATERLLDRVPSALA